MLRKYLIAAMIAGMGLAGCESAAGPNNPGTFSLYLTDAPGDLLAAVVTIDEIYLQGSDDDQQSGRVYLLETPVTANLLDLQNDVLNLVEDVTVPGGRYSQLRLVISGGYIEVIEEEDPVGDPIATRIYASSAEYAADQGVIAAGALQMPSYGTSGLKVNLPGGSVEVNGDQRIVLLDFNVAESFGKLAGNSGKWVMHPVVHASDFTTATAVEFSLTLADGVVLPQVEGEQLELTDFGVTLDKSGDLLTEDFVEKSAGVYRAIFYFLDPGTDYPVTFEAPAGVNVTLDPAFPATVNVGTGTLQLEFEITAVELE